MKAVSSRALWTVAVVLTIAVAAWQRRTGPSYPYRAAAPWDAASRLRLPRSHLTTAPARVAIPASATALDATLLWRRYPTSEPFAAVPLRRSGGELAAEIPAQPPAGKVEYFLQVAAGDAQHRVPATHAVVLRYRGPVPAGILLPHIALMALGLLLGVRLASGAAVGEPVQRPLVLATLALFTLGGLVFGPITQRYAFGAYWTGVPFGWDLTDNKTLLMWLGWLAAAVAPRRVPSRWLVLAAAALMLAAYLVPHSTLGSQLDYAAAAAPPAP